MIAMSHLSLVMEVSVLRMSSVSGHDLSLPRSPSSAGHDGRRHDFTLPLDAVQGLSSLGAWLRDNWNKQLLLKIDKRSYNVF